MHLPAAEREGGDANRRFGDLLPERLHRETRGLPVLRLQRNAVLYISGERGDTLFLIESGWIKRKIYSSCGKASLLDVHCAGDLIGENCVFRMERTESAVAKVPSVLRVIRREQFLELLRTHDMLFKWIELMSKRLEEQQQIISQFVTMNSEQRLAVRLLQLGRKLGDGNGDARGGVVCVRQRITHEELAEMVGTTRSRVGLFLKRFEEIGLIRRTRQGLLLQSAEIQRYVESHTE